MQPESTHSRNASGANIKRIASKEVTLFFASPVAYLFLAAFAAVTLFVFFWGESFFSRNIADVRPLFEWMPVLLIFLASTLTMRLWSEERRTGTLEYVLTQPVPLWNFIVGKFVACLVLLAIALVITLPLPITISLMGDLDWGPVWAGYLATFLLGAAYLSIGLFVSARSDNSIVSLISAVALCGAFYLIGTTTITEFFGNRGGELLRQLGTGSRFDAITRGVIDLRDLYYYLSIIVVFLVLNNFTLKKESWANPGNRSYHRNWRIVTVLLLANALGANLWLGQLNTLRLDATRGNQYSISEATEGYLAQLQEPLLIRGYFSAKTHPLLAPLVPQLQDLVKEYEIASNGKVRVEFVDPVTEPELEQEANQRFGIQPVPFQVADRYQSSIVSSYFNVLIQYGDQYEVLSFNDLIEIKAQSETNVDVQLRNPEHDLTRSIKKVLNSYQAGGNLFDTVQGEITFNAYISADAALPEDLRAFKQTVIDSVTELQQEADGRLSMNVIDPDANGGLVGQQIAEAYGFQPVPTSLFSEEAIYFYLTLENGDQLVQVPLDDLTEGGFERNLQASVKRLAAGFTKTVALVLPTQASANPYQPASGGARFAQLEAFLGSELNVQQEDLSDGHVAGDADILLLMSPSELDEKQLFAVDQFLMQGGTVIAATSPFSVDFSNRSMALQAHQSGLDDWLAHHGLSMEQQLVMDPMNAAFPIPVNRDVGGFQLQEIRMLDYPYFVDIRSQGMNQDNPITADIPQATLSWASPIKVDQQNQGSRQVTELLHSSDGSWLSSSTDILPVNANGVLEFPPQGEQSSQLLAVISAGRFESWFKDKSSPLLTEAKPEEPTEADALSDAADAEESVPSPAVVSGVIARSPESARIILFASNDFLRDEVIQFAGSASGSEYLNTLQLMANTVDWSLEDAGLLSIRARSHFNRTLPPMEHGRQLFWEYLNYVLAAVGLGLVALLQRRRKKARQQQYLQLLA
jgi:ABC-2 type transport system permease protein